MKPFTIGKCIRRSIQLKSNVPGWPPVVFGIEIGVGGISIWKKGCRAAATKRLSWKFIVGQGFIFGKDDDPTMPRIVRK